MGNIRVINKGTVPIDHNGEFILPGHVGEVQPEDLGRLLKKNDLVVLPEPIHTAAKPSEVPSKEPPAVLFIPRKKKRRKKNDGEDSD